MVQPVFIPAVVPSITDEAAAPWVGGDISEGGGLARWLTAEWEATRFDAVRADRTVVNSSGTPQAFALSLADVVHLSTETGPFPNHAQRMALDGSFWLLRTPGLVEHLVAHNAWRLGTDNGTLAGNWPVSYSFGHGGVRPAIIINQSN